jgi:hypothetical protein
MLVENKFSKYLLYAIGEIVLVVIGILIALQVNNWNEDRKVAQASEAHLQKMIIELEAAKARMEYLTTNKSGKYSFGYPPLDEAVANCETLLKMSYKGITKADVPFIVGARFFAGQSSLNVQQDAFEELKNAGGLNSLGSEELITSIKSYNSRVKRESSYMVDLNEQISIAKHKLDDGFGKLLIDHRMDSVNFDTENYPWLFDQKSREYQDMQTGIFTTHKWQTENREKMLVIYKLSDSLIQMIQNELLKHYNYDN